MRASPASSPMSPANRRRRPSGDRRQTRASGLCADQTKSAEIKCRDGSGRGRQVDRCLGRRPPRAYPPLNQLVCGDGVGRRSLSTSCPRKFVCPLGHERATPASCARLATNLAPRRSPAPDRPLLSPGRRSVQSVGGEPTRRILCALSPSSRDSRRAPTGSRCGAAGRSTAAVVAA